MSDTIDLLQIKIEKAKRQLSDDTLNAITAIPWQATILKMKETKGYSFEQLGDLETETELLLCGLLSPEDYPKELEKRMKISPAQANELVNEMNRDIFVKIKDELIKNTERKEEFAKKAPMVNKKVEIIRKPNLTLPELESGDKQKEPATTPHLGEQSEVEIHPMLAKKLITPVQIPSVKTEHTLDNITKTNGGGVDPYREIPE